MNKAVFLDRDGVINRDFLPYHFNKDHFFINEGLWEALLQFRNKGYLLIIISNQGGIAKGLYTVQDVDKLHSGFLKEASGYRIEITEIYFCPHHDLYGKCLCRKPDSLMLERAMARFNIDAKSSYFIGDTERDVQAALKAGVTPVRIVANKPLTEVINLIR